MVCPFCEAHDYSSRLAWHRLAWRGYSLRGIRPRSAAEAAQLDEHSEDDVLALPQRLDLHELLEDELILALPIVPRHGVCPQALPLAAVPEAEAAPNPFAALAALRGRMPRSE